MNSLKLSTIGNVSWQLWSRSLKKEVDTQVVSQMLVRILRVDKTYLFPCYEYLTSVKNWLWNLVDSSLCCRFSRLQGWALPTGEGPAVRNYDLRTEGREPELHAIIPWTVLNWLCTGQWFMQDSLTPTALPFYSQQCLQAVILCWSYPASRLGKPLAHITNWMIE